MRKLWAKQPEQKGEIMAQYRIDPEQKAALDTINSGLDSVRILNTLILTDEDLCVSIFKSDGKRKKGGGIDKAVTIDAAQKERIISVLTVQRTRAIREITSLAKKHGIELDDGEKAVISVCAIAHSTENKKEQTEKEIPA